MSQEPAAPTASGFAQPLQDQSPAMDLSTHEIYFLAPSQSTPESEGGSTPESASVLEQDYSRWAQDEPTDTPGSSPHIVPAPGDENLSQESLQGALGRRISKHVRLPNGRDGKEIEELLSIVFDKESHEDAWKEKHAGVVFRSLTIKGLGLGAALSHTNADFLMAPLRGLKRLITGNIGKAPVRTLLHDFTGCVRPSEMLLVLGRPGSGCSTFLKTIANQREGYEEVLGEVTYGGTTTKEMAQKFRGEILYNPEDGKSQAALPYERLILTSRRFTFGNLDC